MRPINTLLLICIVVAGCKLIITSKYQINRRFLFSNRADYLRHFQENYGITATQLLYPDSSCQAEFLMEVSKAKLSIYYGAFVNDTIEIAKSESLRENLSCAGRVLKEINKSGAYVNDSSVRVNGSFKRYKFLSVIDDSYTDFNRDHKIKVVLLYGHAMGTYFDAFFKQVSEWGIDKNNLLIYVITVDPIQILKK